VEHENTEAIMAVTIRKRNLEQPVQRLLLRE
jgi:hypothetical protein